MNRDQLKNMLQNNKIREFASSNKKNPNIIDMTRNLASTAKNVIQSVAAGNPMNVSEEEANRRKNICEGCNFYNKPQQRCTKCGCFLAVKAYLRAANCPLGKW